MVEGETNLVLYALTFAAFLPILVFVHNSGKWAREQAVRRVLIDELFYEGRRMFVPRGTPTKLAGLQGWMILQGRACEFD